MSPEPVDNYPAEISSVTTSFEVIKFPEHFT